MAIETPTDHISEDLGEEASHNKLTEGSILEFVDDAASLDAAADIELPGETIDDYDPGMGLSAGARLTIAPDGAISVLVSKDSIAGIEAALYIADIGTPVEAQVTEEEDSYRYSFDLSLLDNFKEGLKRATLNARLLMTQVPVELRTRKNSRLLFKGSIPLFSIRRALYRREQKPVPANLSDLRSPPAYRGIFEAATADEFGGWVLNFSDLKSVKLEIELEGILFATTTSSIEREDISAIVGRRVQCGFAVSLAAIRRKIPKKVVELLNLMVEEYPDYRPDMKVRISETEFFLPSMREEIEEISVTDWISILRLRNASEKTELVARAELVQRLARLENYTTDVRLIAFYLPQYHPIPENDAWWGPGFTEWNNVSTAKPLFEGHYQPQLPADLGFYDLRLADTRKAQADLAREYGVSGFCYYYYWFSGRKILDRPLREVVGTGEPDFPFCICWANESWSRRWDGSEQELLVAQEHHHETDIEFIYDILPIIKDPRYICIDGEPLLIIYRVGIIPHPQKLFNEWKEIAKENGLPGLHICMAETFGAFGPYEYGCDSAVEFPPHRVVSELKNHKIPDIPRDYTGNIYDYRDVIQNDLLQRQPPYTRFRTVMPSWDNTSRRGKAGHVFHGASPELYETWLSEVAMETRRRLTGDRRIVFVNAWNEWAEGAHLEPDRRNGRQYLEATRRAISGQPDWRTLLEGLELRDGVGKEDLPQLVRALKSRYTALQESNDFLSRKLKDKEIAWGQSVFTDKVPLSIANKAIVPGGRLEIDRLNQYWSGLWHVLPCKEYLILHGWSFVPDLQIRSDTNSFLNLVDVKTGAQFYAAVWDRIQRPDVVSATNSNEAEALWAGFRFVASLANVPPGEYLMKMLYSGSECSYQAISRRRFVLV